MTYCPYSTRSHYLQMVEGRVSLHVRLQLRDFRRERHLYTVHLNRQSRTCLLRLVWIQISVMLQMIVSYYYSAFNNMVKYVFSSLSPQNLFFTLFLSPFLFVSLILSTHQSRLQSQVPGWCLVMVLRAQVAQERPWGFTGRTRLSSRPCPSLR